MYTCVVGNYEMPVEFRRQRYGSPGEIDVVFERDIYAKMFKEHFDLTSPFKFWNAYRQGEFLVAKNTENLFFINAEFLSNDTTRLFYDQLEYRTVYERDIRDISIKLDDLYRIHDITLREYFYSMNDHKLFMPRNKICLFGDE